MAKPVNHFSLGDVFDSLISDRITVIEDDIGHMLVDENMEAVESMRDDIADINLLKETIPDLDALLDAIRLLRDNWASGDLSAAVRGVLAAVKLED